MAGIGTLAATSGLSASLDSTSPSAWIPPPPGGEGSANALPLSTGDSAEALASQVMTGAVQPPPIPPVVVPETIVGTDNAFGPDPFDANGCPILAPSDMEALATVPYREFRAVSGPESELPPLPEGYDVMPLANPSGIFVESEDVFRFRAISTSDNVPVSFFGRVQRPSGYIIPFNHTLRTSTANTTFTTQPVPGKGILLGAAASVPIGSITIGAVNAVGEIGRVQGGTFTPHTLLFSGQLDDLYPLSTVGGGLPTQTGRPTFLDTSSAASVAAPKNVTVTPNAGKRIRFTRIAFTAATGATVGERNAMVQFIVNSVTQFSGLMHGSIGANCNVSCYASIGSGDSLSNTLATSGGLPVSTALPETLYFYDAVTVSMTYDTPVAGDNIKNAFIRWEES